MRFDRRGTGRPALGPAVREPEGRLTVARRDRSYRRALAIADIVAALTAVVLCVDVLSRDLLLPTVLLGAPLVVLASKLVGLYDRDELVIHKATLDELGRLFHLSTFYALTFFLVSGNFLVGQLSQRQVLGLWCSLFVSSVLARTVARWLVGRRVTEERCVLVGQAGTYVRLADKLRTLGIKARMVGHLAPRRVADSADPERISEPKLASLLEELDVHRLIVEPLDDDPALTLELIRAAKALGVRVSIVPRVLDVVGNSVVFDDLGGMTLLGVSRFGMTRSSWWLKRAFDVVGAAVLLVLATPALAAAAVAIKLDTKGSVLFRQTRVGRGGRRFEMLKLRTMANDAEQRKAELLALNEAEGLFKIAEDPRITRAGRFLRRSHLDELPQLVNVLRGEMSLVGPRPLIASEDETITGYDRRRLVISPGITGPWQVLGHSVPMAEMVKIDYLYLAGWSMWRDLKTLARTAGRVVSRRGL